MADKTIPQRKPMRNNLTVEFVRAILDYDPNTGKFRWKARTDVQKKGWWAKRYAGKTAGTLHKDGGIEIKINNRGYKASRLAYLIVTGEWPNEEIDHENRRRSDNTWDNLRDATPTQNCQNRRKRSDNSSGYKGVSWHKHIGKWQAYITTNKKRISLGYFDTPEEAAAAYKAAAIELHREFSCIDSHRTIPEENDRTTR